MRHTLTLCSAAALLIGCGSAYADNEGFYIDGSVGHSEEHFDSTVFNVRGSDAGYQLGVGFRPISLFAGELDYVDMGRASGGENYADTYGITAFGVGFLPIPLVDVYGKLGAIEWRTNANSPTLSYHRTGTDLAYGVGAGMHWGALGARVEYERFEVSHASTMDLATIGLTWTFL